MEEADHRRAIKKCVIIGRGGFGTVYLASTGGGGDPTLPPFVAVKSVTSKVTCDFESIMLETSILNNLLEGCPYVIPSYGHQLSLDAETGEATFDLLLEYASGGSLYDFLQPHGLPESGVRYLTSLIVKGLKAIHDHGLVHCDLKPANILLVSSASPNSPPVPKIADFGLAKFAGLKLHDFRGTTLYMAPESVCNSEYEPPSDIWALGCIVLEMFTGCPAWDNHSAAASTSSLLCLIGDTTEIPIIPRYLSQQAKDFLAKCLVRDPELRWTPDMLLSHPFLSTNGERGIKRRMTQVRLSCEPRLVGLGSEDYIPRQVGKRQKMTSGDEAVHHLPSFHATSGPNSTLSSDASSVAGLGSADYIPLETP